MNCLTTAHRVISFYTPLPVLDYWRVVANLPAYQGFHLGVLWTQNNEHRIVFPEIVFGLDMLVAHGCMILPLLLSFLCYVATWLLLCATITATRAFPNWIDS
jgi:uncharacterized membrane protein